MTSSLPSSIEQQLQDIGYTKKFPMSIRAVERYKIHDETHILKNIDITLKLNNQNTVLSAALQQFPFQQRNNFELVIDDNFLIQQRGIKIYDCHDFKIIFSTTNQQRIPHAEKFFIDISNSHNFIIENANITGGRNAIAVTDCNQFIIKKCRIEKAVGYAIIIHSSSQFEITQCQLNNNLASGIMVIGNSKYGTINNTQCNTSTGFLNQDAGIHLCATSAAVTLKEIPEHCHEILSIEQKEHRPYGIIIENCQLNDNRAQGIYLEGAVNCLIRYNELARNNKEGICFDWGSSHNFFNDNNVYSNGERKNLSQDEIIADYITEYPILTDKSSSMKLAGISIDNGSMNAIFNNRIVKNYGGGVKLVRSSLLNSITTNLISYNSLGSNKYKPFFYGISAEGIQAINNEFDGNEVKLLEFLPSELNTFSENIIRGHSIAIHQDKDSTRNTSTDNKARFYMGGAKQIHFFMSYASNSVKNKLQQYFGLLDKLQ